MGGSIDIPGRCVRKKTYALYIQKQVIQHVCNYTIVFYWGKVSASQLCMTPIDKEGR